VSINLFITGRNGLGKVCVKLSKSSGVHPGDPLAAAIVSLADDPIAKRDIGRCAPAWAEENMGRDSILEAVFGALGDG
jgi:hypothetical protein